MKEQISPELFAHLVELAALELTDAESEYLRGELNSQLNAINELEAIPLDTSFPPSLHGIVFTSQISAALRSDVWQPYERSDAILDQAPQVSERYVVVPDIPHTTLE